MKQTLWFSIQFNSNLWLFEVCGSDSSETAWISVISLLARICVILISENRTSKASITLILRYYHNPDYRKIFKSSEFHTTIRQILCNLSRFWVNCAESKTLLRYLHGHHPKSKILPWAWPDNESKDAEMSSDGAQSVVRCARYFCAGLRILMGYPRWSHDWSTSMLLSRVFFLKLWSNYSHFN